LVEETGVPGENHWPVASHWQTLSHNVVSSGYLVLVEILEKMWNKQISLLYWKLGFFDNLFSSHEILQDEILVSSITLGSKMSCVLQKNHLLFIQIILLLYVSIYRILQQSVIDFYLLILRHFSWLVGFMMFNATFNNISVI
jgi:hypothetical protein